VQQGCYSVQYAIGSTCATVATRTDATCPSNSSNGCNPSLGGTAFSLLGNFTPFASSCITPPSTCTGNGTLTFTMSSSCNCVFVGGTVERTCTEGSAGSTQCINGTIVSGSNGKQIQFTNGGNPYTGAFRLVINCGNSTACGLTVTTCPTCPEEG